MFRHIQFILVLAIGLLAAAPAVAQDDLLDEEASLLEGDGLEERVAPAKKVLDDPDPKLLKKLEAVRASVETKMNGMQQSGRNLEKVSDGLDKISQKLLKALDGYTEAHNVALEAYRTAISADKTKAKKKAAKKVIKLRKTFIKRLKKIDKIAGKLQKLAEKLAAKVQEEDAEGQVAEE